MRQGTKEEKRDTTSLRERRMKFERLLRELFLQPAILMGLECPELIINRCIELWYKVSLCLEWGRLYTMGNLNSRRHFAAYVFYKVLYEQEIYRTAAEVAESFNTSEARLLLAEDIYCIQSNTEKIYISVKLLFERIASWLYLKWDQKKFIGELIEKLEKKYFGKSSENVMMIALVLSNDYLKSDKLARDFIDMERASWLLKVPVIREKEAKALAKMCMKELLEIKSPTEYWKSRYESEKMQRNKFEW